METENPARFAGHRKAREKQFGAGAVAIVSIGEDNLKAIAAADPPLEVQVMGEDPHHLVDQRSRHVIAQRGLVKAVIEPRAGAFIAVVFILVAGTARRPGRAPGAGLLFLAGELDRHEGAPIVDRDHRLDPPLGHE